MVKIQSYFLWVSESTKNRHFVTIWPPFSRYICLYQNLQFQKLKDYLNQLKMSFSEIVGMCPTGWEFKGVSSGEGLDDITSKHPFPDVYIYGEVPGRETCC